MDLFITCGQGIEPLLIEELASFGYSQTVTGYRGVKVQNVDMDAVYRINYQSRLAGRVFMPLANFHCRDAKALYKAAMDINWMEYIPEGKTIAIDANVAHPLLRNSLFAAQVVKDAICDQFREKTGDRPSVDIRNPDVQLNLFIHDGSGVISFDTSGQSLHKRGYREETVDAPMQETMAAALLKLAKYQGTEILYDPCFGSGTLLIEAALMASKTPPGYLRKHWGFFSLPQYSQERWLKIKAEADGMIVPLVKGHFFGTDSNKKAVYAAKVNLRAAGIHQFIEIAHCDFRDYTPPVKPDFIIVNPPYGKRLDEVDQLRSLYRSLGEWMKHKAAKPAKGFVFTGSMELTKEVGLSASRRYVLDNGGIDSRLLEFDLY
ncbi:MAG TPA: THUMP domain-containing protein [Parachlamydiaceae bacterium]|nr:THUMP domain-containing protein [Parachlamydiaceae bacterium]